ncbi:hypothetical protein FOC1_h10017514, partial [Fusarium oxysporum f. sp. cubense race 1]
MADERPTPRDEDIPGGVPVTPSVNSITQRETSLIDNLRPASFGALTFEPQQQHAPILDRNSSSSIVLPRGESTEEKRKSANDPHRLPWTLMPSYTGSAAKKDEESAAKEDLAQPEDPNAVGWDGPDDPNNPMN